MTDERFRELLWFSIGRHTEHIRAGGAGCEECEALLHGDGPDLPSDVWAELEELYLADQARIEALADELDAEEERDG